MNQLRNRNTVSTRKKVTIICIVLMFITMGFAALSATLGIASRSRIGKIVHDVHFENVSENKSTMEAKNKATIREDDATQIDFVLELKVPGQYYEFEVDVVNSGTIDAMLSNIAINGIGAAQSKYLNISYTYYDGTEVKINDALPVGERDRIKVRVDFKYDLSNEDLPSEGTISNLSLKMTYIHDRGTGVKRNKLYKYKFVDKFATLDNVASAYVENKYGINFMSNYLGTSSNDVPNNGNGLYVRAGTENDENPIFYYRGDVEDNNVLFAGFCWKIIRTTETGGTKLVYNGTPMIDGTCDTTGDNTHIGYSSYNNNGDSLTDVGYMYGDRYPVLSDVWKGDVRLIYIGRQSINANIAITNEEPGYSNRTYSLNNILTINSKDILNSSQYNRYYTCLNLNTSCSSLYYILGSDDTYIYFVYLSDGDTIEGLSNLSITMANGIAVNEDGTYSLSGEITNIKYLDWYANYENANDKYFCVNMTIRGYVDTTCEEIGHITTSFLESFDFDYVHNYQFGNDVEWDGTKYILKDTYELTYSAKISDSVANELATRHYTCLSNSNSCEKVYYIVLFREMNGRAMILNSAFNQGTDTFKYIELSDGKTLSNVQSQMHANTNDSEIKKVIDQWYANNMVWYMDMLDQDTIWCNNRNLKNSALNGKDYTNYIGYNITYDGYFGGSYVMDPITRLPIYKPLLTGVEACPNEADQFTVTTSKVGNKALTYPVGLLTSYELSLAGYGIGGDTGLNVYLGNGLENWTMSPNEFNNNASYISTLSSRGISSMILPGSYFEGDNSNVAVRPVISLKKESEIISGDGTVSNPYVVKDNSRYVVTGYGSENTI